MPLRVSTETGDVTLPKNAAVATDATTPEPHDVPIPQSPRSRQTLIIDERAIGRSEIANEESLPVSNDLGMRGGIWLWRKDRGATHETNGASAGESIT